MTPEFQREEALFNAASELESAAARTAYLARECAGDERLRKRIEQMLESDTPAAEYFRGPRPGFHGQAPVPEPNLSVLTTTMAGYSSEAIGRYRLLEKLGEGGFGTVYVAEQTQPVRRRVALKVIKAGMHTREVIARFNTERQALALMDHPNIAKVLDFGSTNADRPYFVMELVLGILITNFCDQHHLSTHRRLHLFIKICQAIQHAHQKGIIHRDIKPSNILVSLEEGVPVPKVIDFGIAKAVEGRLTDSSVYTQAHHFIGTPAYMSPEQAELGGVDIDTRSDIYSLGVLLYELLTGKTPFDPVTLTSAGLDEARRVIRETEPARPSTRLHMLGVQELTAIAQRRSTEPPKLLRMVRGDLDWIVMKCLEKDRNRRYETASGLATDLKRYLAQEPVVARPPSPGYRFQKAFQRNRLVFIAVTIVAIALLLATGVSTWQVLETRRAQQAETAQRLAAQAAQKRAETAQAAESQERRRADAETMTARRHLYSANMNLAQQGWDQSNLGRMRQLLQEEIAYPDRGFEWYYWLGQMHLELKTVRGHGAAVTSVAISPDNRWMITASSDQTARIWDWASGETLLTLTGHASGIWSVAVSPDGRRVVTGSDDLTAKVWDTETGRELLTLKGHLASIPAVAFSADGRRIVTAGQDSTVKLWDTLTGAELKTLKGLHRAAYTVACSPDGRRIAAGGADYVTKVWDADSGGELLTLEGHDLMIWSMAFSPDSQRLATGSDDRTVKIWDVVGGHLLANLPGHRGGILSVAFSPDGQRIITGSVDQTAKIWEVTSGRELFSIKGHNDRVTSVAFSSDGQHVVTGSEDRTAKVWEAVDTAERSTLVAASPILSVAISPNGQEIITGTVHEIIQVWDARNGHNIRTLTGHRASILALTYSPDGRHIVSGSWDRTAKVWDAADGHELLTLTGHTDSVTSVSVSPNSRSIVTASLDATARVWDLAGGQELLRIAGHEGAINSAAFSPDGRRIVTGGRDQTAKVWDATTGRELLTMKGHKDMINSAAFSPDGRRIVTGSRDQIVKVWDAANGQELLTLKGHKAGIHAVTFSPDGRRIITASADQTAVLWDADSGRELISFQGHSDRIRAVAISTDGQEIVTGSEDRTARIWRRASAAQVLAWRNEEQTAGRP